MRRLFAPEYQAPHPELIEARKKRFLAVDPQTFHGACEALATLDLRDSLKTVGVPTPVLVGEQDEANRRRCPTSLARACPHARLTVLEGCAHVPQLQMPEEFILATSDVISQLLKPPTTFTISPESRTTHTTGATPMLRSLPFNVLPIALAAICAFSLPPKAAAQSEPIRIGFLTVRTGPLAAGGRQMEEGIQLLLKERNNTLAGRKVELIIADTGGNPASAKSKVQELVERNHVQAIIGPLATFEAIAIDDYILKAKVPLITPTSAAQNDLAEKKKNEFVIHAVGTAAQPTHVLGQYASKKMGLKRIAMIADDFAYGHEGAAGFMKVFEDNGGRVIQRLWSPLNVADYGTFISQIKPNADGVYAGFAGINGLRFLKQYKEYQLKPPVLGNPTSVDEGVLKAMGDEALGVVSASWYSAQIDTPDNRKFVKAIQSENKVTPGFYTAGLFLEEALKVVKGNIEDQPAFLKALHATKLSSGPMGPIRLDEYAKPVMNIYIRKVERKNGQLVNSIVETLTDVNQFWTYDPKAFLASPAYSREVPGARYLE
jgi:branched-chain amino acid transport system substrate-binding protein